MQDFKTIAVFNYPHEIVVLRHILELEKIPFFFDNETMLSVAPFYTHAIGGIHLKIHPNDFEAVQLILNDLNTHLKIV